MKYIHYVDFFSKTKIYNFFNRNKKTRGGGFGVGTGGDENLIINFLLALARIKSSRTFPNLQ